jgi:hypothetical protein
MAPLFGRTMPGMTPDRCTAEARWLRRHRVLVSLLALLLAGTPKIPLTATVARQPAAPGSVRGRPCFRVGPSTRQGEEGVSVQGSLLILLLVLIGFAAWKGLERITERANPWTWIALALAAVTLIVAALRIVPSPHGLTIEVTGRVIAVAAALCGVVYFARKLAVEHWRAWLWEAWRFVRQIFPLLVVGVFAVG